jgi:hypothetical protein
MWPSLTCHGSWRGAAAPRITARQPLYRHAAQPPFPSSLSHSLNQFLNWFPLSPLLRVVASLPPPPCCRPTPPSRRRAAHCRVLPPPCHRRRAAPCHSRRAAHCRVPLSSCHRTAAFLSPHCCVVPPSLTTASPQPPSLPTAAPPYLATSLCHPILSPLPPLPPHVVPVHQLRTLKAACRRRPEEARCRPTIAAGDHLVSFGGLG